MRGQFSGEGYPLLRFQVFRADFFIQAELFPGSIDLFRALNGFEIPFKQFSLVGEASTDNSEEGADIDAIIFERFGVYVSDRDYR